VSEPPRLAAYLQARRGQIEAALDGYLPRPPACPAIVSEAMRYSLLAGGKRLRPILTLATAEAVADGGGDATAAAMPAACAIELIHTYSLVHDDLPAMDNDTLRRGRPTAHVVFGDGIAILAGDGLLTEAFALLAREPARDEPLLNARKLRTIGLIALAAGACGMVGGQAIDLHATFGAMHAAADGQDALRDMDARKTGALIRAAACAGAVMAGGSDAAVEIIDRFATELGLAFQIVDDILDVESTPETIGKTPGKDAGAGKPTYPALFGLDTSRRLARECVERARNLLAAAGIGGRLPEIADWVVGRVN
jgi:geranylgeranyl diphosphate synthase type II